MFKKTKQKIKGKKLSSKQLQSAILKLFRRHSKNRMNPKQVAAKLKVSNNRDSVQYAIEQLVEQRLLETVGSHQYKVSSRAFDQHSGGNGQSGRAELEGIVDMTRTGSGYVVVEGRDEDIHVAAKNMNTAQHGDKVKIRTWTPRGRRRPEGEVIEVLERATMHYIGTYFQYARNGQVVTGGRGALDIHIKFEDAKGAVEGDKVVAQITGWSKDREPTAFGKITAVLGQAGSNEVEMQSILISNGFQLEFNADTLAESEALPETISKEEIENRLDIRNITTFTIDPDTAKDFDDALSLRWLDKGEYEIGVHIADVTHYLRPDTALDKEALERSTSVYLVDRVLPMLPEKLSNHLCSLIPHEDRLAFSAIFTFDTSDVIKKRWFGRTIIHSDRRFTYEEAQEVLDTKEGEFVNELQELNRVAKVLRKRRFRKGSIDFDSDEVKFKLDENGVPVEVYLKERKETHMLIEDFMLLANREVATYILKKGEREEEIPFVYRVHDEPDPEKVENFAAFAREMGLDLDVSTPGKIATAYNRMAEAIEKKPRLSILEPIAIRTMAKAIYTTENIGHYGLGFDNYTHFTSPIRRYADVLVHRLLHLNLIGSHREDKAALEEKCGHISRQERRAMDAERESVKYKQVEYMSNHIGEVFPGIINGIIDRGFFVELTESRCEGMVGFDTMDEPFEVEEGRLRMRGRITGQELRMGQEILVQIVRTDLLKRQIEMVKVEEAEDKSARVFE